MIEQHRDRGRWWTTATTRWVRVTVIRQGGPETVSCCETCNGDVYGAFGDGYRCLGCGARIVNVGENGLPGD